MFQGSNLQIKIIYKYATPHYPFGYRCFFQYGYREENITFWLNNLFFNFNLHQHIGNKYTVFFLDEDLLENKCKN